MIAHLSNFFNLILVFVNVANTTSNMLLLYSIGEDIWKDTVGKSLSEKGIGEGIWKDIMEKSLSKDGAKVALGAWIFHRGGDL